MAVKIKTPPDSDEQGVLQPMVCRVCGHEEDCLVSRKVDPVVTCCRKSMQINWSRFRIGLSARGPGSSSTKLGQAKKRDMIRRSEKLAETQWEQHEVPKVQEGSSVENYTPGSPLDPNSKFNKGKKKSKPIVSYSKQPKR